MYCMKCGNDLAECTCPDLNERLARVNQSPHVFIQTCKKCGEHHSRCKCEEPDFTELPSRPIA